MFSFLRKVWSRIVSCFVSEPKPALKSDLELGIALVIPAIALPTSSLVPMAPSAIIQYPATVHIAADKEAYNYGYERLQMSSPADFFSPISSYSRYPSPSPIPKAYHPSSQHNLNVYIPASSPHFSARHSPNSTCPTLSYSPTLSAASTSVPTTPDTAISLDGIPNELPCVINPSDGKPTWTYYVRDPDRFNNTKFRSKTPPLQLKPTDIPPDTTLHIPSSADCGSCLSTPTDGVPPWTGTSSVPASPAHDTSTADPFGTHAESYFADEATRDTTVAVVPHPNLYDFSVYRPAADAPITCARPAAQGQPHSAGGQIPNGAAMETPATKSEQPAMDARFSGSTQPETKATRRSSQLRPLILPQYVAHRLSNPTPRVPRPLLLPLKVAQRSASLTAVPVSCLRPAWPVLLRSRSAHGRRLGTAAAGHLPHSALPMARARKRSWSTSRPPRRQRTRTRACRTGCRDRSRTSCSSSTARASRRARTSAHMPTTRSCTTSKWKNGMARSRSLSSPGVLCQMRLPMSLVSLSQRGSPPSVPILSLLCVSYASLVHVRCKSLSSISPCISLFATNSFLYASST
ncbi:hypothetical protein B0H21DRAFT_143211 [Amylocystis lapponica]|nr:hypothetical protein B0H21DRAFT_143211 [Amylocystis lapponica]